MIEKIKIKQFGGIQNKEIELKEGLNVILGNNETGKSTFMQALFYLLFQNAKYLKTHKSFIEKAIPYPDGDMAQAVLLMNVGDEQWKLEKIWSNKRPMVSLHRGESILTDEEEIQAQLASILPYGEGTYAHIIFSSQEAFKKIFENIKKDNASYNQIKDLSKRLSIELSGLSVNAYQETLKKHYKELTSHWDMENQRPEGNRGIDNPYKKEVGKILGFYYEKENLKDKIQKSEINEDQIAALTEKLQKIKEELAETGKQRKNDELMEDDLRKYEQVRKEKKQQEKELTILTESYSRWGALELTELSLNQQLKEFSIKLEKVESEKQQRDRYEVLQGYQKKIKEAEIIEHTLQEAEQQLASVKVFTAEHKKQYEELMAELKFNRAKLEAVSMEFHVQRGQISLITSEEETCILQEGEKKTSHGYGKIIWEEDTQIEIKSLHLDVDRLRQEQQRIKESLDRLYNILELSEESEILKNFATYSVVSKTIEENKIKQKLLSFDFDREAITQELKNYAPQSIREKSILEQEYARLIEEQQVLSKQWDKIIYEKETLEKTYETKEKLLSLMMEQNYQVKKLEESIKAFTDKGITYEGDYDQFATDLRQLREKEKRLLYEESDVKQSLVEHEVQRPEISVEEMNELHQDLALNFEKALDQAKKISKIIEIFQETCYDLEKNSEGTLAAEFSHNLSYITQGKYNAIEMSDLDNLLIKSSDNMRNLNILSEGTFEAVILAFRLAVINQLSNGKKDFTILDDCLLNMDRDRQKRSAELIREHAKNSQVIFTTCNKEMAELLSENANLIQL